MRRYLILIWAACTLLVNACGSTTSGGTGAPTNNATTGPTVVVTTIGAIQVIGPWARAVVAMGGALEGGMPTATGMGESQPTAAAMDESQPTAAAMGEGEMGGANGAAYMTLRNTGTTADRLISAQSDVAKTIELHTVIQNGDVMEMRPVEAIDVPAGGETTLKPGGFHVMLIDLTRELKSGDTFAVTLQFEQAGTVDIQVKVQQQ